MVYTASSRGSISIVTPSQRKSFSSSQPPSLSHANSLTNLQNSLSSSSGNSSNVVTQTGVTSVGDNKNGKSCAFVNVIFPKPFSKQPIVHGQVLIDQHTMTSSSQGVVKEVSNTYAVTILSTTTTGFCCAVRRVSKKKEKPWISNIRLQWFATLPSFCSGRTVVGVPNPIHTPNPNIPSGSLNGTSSSDTIMMLANGNNSSMIMNPSISSQAANSNNLVYLMSVTINLPPIPTSWNHGYNGSTATHPSKQHAVYTSTGDLYSSSFDSKSLMNSQVTVPESPTVSTNLMYSNNAPTLIPSHPPVVIVTPHSSDGNSDDTFIASVREVYPNRFVAVVRRISFDSVSKPWTQPIKLNWTVFYNSPQIPNPFGKDCIIKAGILPVGQSITSDDYVDREIRFLQNDIPNIPGNDFVMPRMVICTPRCDPQLPSNDIHSVTIKTISPYGFSVNLRHADSRTWHQNLYICYLAFYKVKRPKTKKTESDTVSPPVIKKSKVNGPTVVPYNTQIFIKNCTNGFVLEANLNDNSVVITSEKSFLLSQSQRFIFRESGFIELSQNSDYVLECITLEEGSDIVVSEKRESDNATQKWLVFQPVNPLSTESVCIANVGNLNLVLDCENDRGSAPYLSTLNMSVGSSSSQQAGETTPTLAGENSHDQTLTMKDKSKTQQWRFTMVQENL